MRTLCYGTAKTSEHWHQLLVAAGMAPIMTHCQPPNVPSASQFVQGAWDVVLVEHGFEQAILVLVMETTRWDDHVPPVFVLGGKADPETVDELMLNGATAVLGEHEVGCLPQMLRQQAQLAYLECLLAEPRPQIRANASADRHCDPRVARNMHELNNQIMSISLYTELVLERSSGDQEASADLERILAAAIRANDLIKGMQNVLESSTVPA